jgi:hypothetical protein
MPAADAVLLARAQFAFTVFRYWLRVFAVALLRLRSHCSPIGPGYIHILGGFSRFAFASRSAIASSIISNSA